MGILTHRFLLHGCDVDDIRLVVFLGALLHELFAVQVLERIRFYDLEPPGESIKE